MLDDVQLGYHDSDVRTFILRGLKSEFENVLLQEDSSVVFRHTITGMSGSHPHMKQWSNHTGHSVSPETVLHPYIWWVNLSHLK